jgi:signal transduction histidine kinase/ActR/RegA family two-component response regulator
MRTFSIKQKLLLITMSSSATALLLVAAAFLTYTFFSFRQQMLNDLSTLTQIVGDQNSAALTYGDRQTAQDNLETLADRKAIEKPFSGKRKSRIIAACFYANNNRFAWYRDPEHSDIYFPLKPGLTGWRFADGRLSGYQHIFLNGEDIGALYVCSNLDELHTKMWRYAAIMFLFICSALAVVYLLASRLQRIISRPISHLAKTAEIVSSEKNYSIRAVKQSDDELGHLIDGFNGMLSQIQVRDVALQRINDSLEKRVDERTRDLQQQFDRISLLNQITFAVAARQDSESIVMVVLQQLEHYLPLDFTSAYWFDAETKRFKVMARGPKAWALVERYQLQSELTLADVAFEKCARGEMVYLSDLSQNDSPIAQRISASENFSGLIVPLFLDSKMFGLLIFLRRGLDAIDEPEREFIRSLSLHVALAVRQAQLYQDLQKAYNDLHKTQQTVMQQERLKALGQMASGIAHDINNALSPIVGFAGLIAVTEPNLTADTKKYLGYIKTAGEDITHIVAGLREFYRMREENEALHTLNLNPLARQVIDMTRPRWRDLSQLRSIMIDVTEELAPEGLEIVGIESEIREALTNLVINAVDALPAGGRITVRTRNAGANAIIEVNDNGTGMDEQTRKRCLEPFYSTKGRRGTGLGLAMVYGIMERHHGKIEIATELGQGTTMRLVFPANKPELPPAKVGIQNEPAPGPFRILCIDDEPTIRELLSEMLRYDHHDVEMADGGKTGVAAFRAARAEGKPFDVVVTDFGMPHMDGREVAVAIKAEAPAAPVIMLTGWGAFMQDEHYQEVDGILSKPPQLEEIRAMLRRVTAGVQAKS